VPTDSMQAIIKRLKKATSEGRLPWRQYLILRERIDSLIETTGGIEKLVLPIASECPEVLSELMDIITDIYAEPYIDEKNQEAMLGWVYPFIVEAPASLGQSWPSWVLPIDGQEIADFFLEEIRTQFDYIYAWVYPRLYPPHLLLEYWQHEDHLTHMQDLADGLDSLEPPDLLPLESESYKQTPFHRTRQDTVMMPRVLLFHVYASSRRDHERLMEMAFPTGESSDPYSPAKRFGEVFLRIGQMVEDLLRKEYPSLKVSPAGPRFLPLGTSYEKTLAGFIVSSVAEDLCRLSAKPAAITASVLEISKEAEIKIEIGLAEASPRLLVFKTYLPERAADILKPLGTYSENLGIPFTVDFSGQSAFSRKIAVLDSYSHLRK